MCFRNKNTILNPNKLSNSKILKAKYRRRKKNWRMGKKICWFVLCGWIEGESMSAVFYSLKSIVWPRKQIKQHTSTWNIDKWLNNLLFSRNKNVIGGNNLFFWLVFCVVLFQSVQWKSQPTDTIRNTHEFSTFRLQSRIPRLPHDTTSDWNDRK